MKAQDKDFDQLFSTKLADLEIEPSANVWNNIASELDGEKKEKGGIPFMRIAATIVVLMAVGLYFIKPENKVVALHAAVIQNTEVQDSRPSIAAIQTPVVTESATTETTTSVKHPQTAYTTSRTQGTNTAQQTADTAQSKPQYVAENTTPVTNTTQVQVIDPVQQAVPVIKSNVIANNAIKNTAAPVIANVPLTVNKLAAKEPTKRRRIHTLGDLLNVVIAKVDKREDKLIEFNNTTDDDSFNVTGVNLGLIKAKKDN